MARSLISKKTKLAVLVSLSFTALQGCATSYQSVKREAQAVREAIALTSEIPVTKRATCIRIRLVGQGMDPSRLRVLSDSKNVTISEVLIAPEMPQINFELETQRVLSETGVTVHLGSVKINPEVVRHKLSVNITSYTPLSESISGVDDLDLMVLGVNRDMLVAKGTVRATAVFSSWDGVDYTVWTTSQSMARFYQIKGRQSLNLALTTGRATVGTGRERIEVSSVQDAAISVAHDAVVSVVAKALAVNC